MNKQTNSNDNSMVGGAILVLVGFMLLVGEFGRIDLPETAIFALMPLIGAMLLVKGFLTKQAKSFISGSIVGSIGCAIIAEANPFNWLILDDIPEGAALMFIFAAGWLSIVLLTAIFSDEWQWWAIIPATIFALIGATVVYGGIFTILLTFAGKSWPLILVGLGIKVLFEHKSEYTEQKKATTLN